MILVICIFFPITDFYHYSFSYSNEFGYWNHFAITHNNGTLYLFVNGSLIHTCSTLNISITNESLNFLNVGYSRDMTNNSHINDICIIYNQCLWTSNFDVPNYYLTGDHELPHRILSSQVAYPKTRNGDYFEQAYLF